MERKDAILQRINEIRRIKQRNIHDCAAFLNISREGYLKFEQGFEMLSLPEIEILALYLGVSPLIFFQPDHQENQKLAILEEKVRPTFTNLRHKMLHAKITGEMHKKSITIDQIEEQTDIPVAELKAYLNGEKPIPFDRLLEISESVSLTPEEMIDPLLIKKDGSKTTTSIGRWEREFSGDDNQATKEDSSYEQLILALQKLPRKDQAEVAKVLLEKLNSITIG